MATVKLGSKEFDVDSEEIVDVRYCDVTSADCTALAARMNAGEMSRLKTLSLVRLFLVVFLIC
jgi:hypothetical protein